MSAKVVDEYLRDVEERGRGSLHFPVDQPLPKALVEKLIAVRLAEVAPASR